MERTGSSAPSDARPRPSSLPAWLGSATFLLTAAAVALVAASMAVYPGGSLADPRAEGYDLLHNYFCDLIRPLAHNDEPNETGMLLAQLGMLATAASLVPLFVLLPRLSPGDRRARASRTLGLAAAALSVAVPLTPSSVSPWWHTAAIALAGLPGFLALSLATAGVLGVRREYPRLAVLTGCMLASAVVNAGLYAATFVTRWADAWALPSAQKVGWALLVAWILAASRSAARTGRHP